MKALAIIAVLTILVTPSLFAQAAPVETKAPAVQNVTPDAAEKALKERKDLVVVDIRTPEEFKAGHIAGAKNIDFLGADFAKEVGALDKNKTYLVHCGSGRRSTNSLEVFKQQKFSSILHLNEGFKAWEAAGKPVEK